MKKQGIIMLSIITASSVGCNLITNKPLENALNKVITQNKTPAPVVAVTPVKNPVESPKDKKDDKVKETPSPNPIPLPPVITPTPSIIPPPVSPTPPELITPDKIIIVPGSLFLYQNNTGTLRAFVKDTNGKDINNAKVTWQSNNPDIVKVDQNGEIIAIGSGNTTVKATYEGISGSADITVNTAPISKSFANLRLYVYDDAANLIDGATITATPLAAGEKFLDGSTTANVLSVIGMAFVQGVPAGVQVKLTATKAGFTPREITTSFSGSGDVYFGLGAQPLPVGAAGGAVYALSDKPEVIAIEPAYNSIGIAPTASFKLTFSENMNTSSVEDGFLIETNTDQTGGSPAAFSVGAAYGLSGADVYDKSSYDISWNGQNEVTFTPKSGYPLLTDKESPRIPQYRVTWKTVAAPFKDITNVFARQIENIGQPNESGPFRITTTWKGVVPFAITTDTTAPKVDAVYISDKNTIKVRFNEPMALYPLVFSNFYDTNNGANGAGALFDKGTYTYFASIDGITWYDITNGGCFGIFVDGSDATSKTIKLDYRRAAGFAATTVTGIQAIGTTNFVMGSTANLVPGDTIVIATVPVQYRKVTAILNGTNVLIAALTTSTAGGEAVTLFAGAGGETDLTGLTAKRLKIVVTGLTDPAGNEITIESDKSGSVVVPTL